MMSVLSISLYILKTFSHRQRSRLKLLATKAHQVYRRCSGRAAFAFAVGNAFEQKLVNNTLSFEELLSRSFMDGSLFSFSRTVRYLSFSPRFLPVTYFRNADARYFSLH